MTPTAKVAYNTKYANSINYLDFVWMNFLYVYAYPHEFTF